MNTFNNSMTADVSPLKKMVLALEKKPISDRHQKEADFSEAYPIIEQHLARKVPVKAVIDAFSASYGYTIHAPRFRKLLETERKRRAEAGETLMCKACGNPLNLLPETDLETTSAEKMDVETNGQEGEA